ncbi:MAG: hypothetical protein VXW65_00720 [Pseudomonadota bacterium]|nr:hypothetical protein [Pseudomonadota bacterium]
MSVYQQEIQASATTIYQLLSDVGGWRIWNRRVAFSALDGDTQTGARGVLYLRRLAWLRWSLLIDEVIENQKISMHSQCLGVHVHFTFEIQADQRGERCLLVGRIRSESLLGRLTSSRLLPLWRGFLGNALQGVQYAAEAVQLASTTQNE